MNDKALNQPRVLRDLAGLSAEELRELAGLVAAIFAAGKETVSHV